jgi:ornithine cyclodeaminase
VTVLVLSSHDVEDLLDLSDLVDALAGAMADLSAGRASMPLRNAASVPEREALVAAMPASLPSTNALAVKLVSLFPRNRDRPPLAIMDGTFITATRTAAGSVLASRYLARDDARVVAVVGTGVQARAHAHAFGRRAGIERIVVAGRDAGSVASLARELATAGLPAEAAVTIQDAVRRADIVCVTTHSDVPVVRRAWLRSGTHVNSVGYNTAGAGEVDLEIVRDAVLVVESRAAVLAPPPSGAVELRRAIEAGLVTADHIHAEIGEIISGVATGRVDADAITLYKSVGVAVQDAAAAGLVLAAAARKGAGTAVAL